tara:strand:- start:727 stop:1170 length:444 start_codon:yes stop_codon:yes gene_type:complete
MIPNLFSKLRIPKKLPKGMQKAVEKLRKSKNKEDCLRKAYNILTKKYRGYHFRTYIRFFELFITDANKLWNKSGFLHCTNMNYLMRILLVKSGFFKENDITPKLTLIWYKSIHQYLNIKINRNKSINVDPWGKVYGIKFGDFAHGFH